MERLRVLTFNIWNRQGPWEKRLQLIRDGIRKLAPDVIGLQEVILDGDRTQADDIREGLGYQAAFGMAHDLGEGVHFGNAVLSRWPIERRAVYPLPTADHDERRALLLAEIATPYGKLPFFVTHLNWKFHHGVVRESQVEAIADILMRVEPMGRDLPAILVGDFNAVPESAEIRFLRGLQSLNGKSIHFSDCYEHTGAPPGHTFDSEKNPFAAHTHEFPRRIDYIFVRGPELGTGRGKPVFSEVVMKEVVDGVAPSDHYGVLAEIKI
jgi:endonuclease/exonuclease/phosphatase family metal-dependent hydrolase